MIRLYCFLPVFLKGLVSRYILGRYATNWGPNISQKLSINLFGEGPNWDAPLNWAKACLTDLQTKLQLRATWDSCGSTDYFQCLTMLTDASPQLAAIICGWCAAEQYDLHPQQQQGEWQYIFGLLGTRYTTGEIGMMMGYTFSFISGFLKNERTNKIKTGGGELPGLFGQTSVPSIYHNLSDNMNYLRSSGEFQGDQTFNLPSLFYNFITAEFFALIQKDLSNTKSLIDYKAYSSGYVSGMTLGADTMYAQLFNTGWNEGYQSGYTSGYSNGFRDGYSQGYNAGWQAGYSDVPQAQSGWSSLGNITDSLGSLLGNANQVVSIVGDVVSVGTVIAGLFG